MSEENIQSSGGGENSLSISDELEAIVASFFEARRRGEALSVEQLTARHPELADRVRALLPTLELLESAADSLAPPPSFTLEQKFGDYAILRELGRGGMGIVYEARDEVLGRQVALKILSGHPIHDERQLQRFRRESQAAARLSHPNIVPVFGVGDHQGVHYYVMQYVEGASLGDELKSLANSKAQIEALQGGVDSPEDRRETGEAPVGAESGAERAVGETSSSIARGDSSSALSSTAGDPGYFRSVARIGRRVAEALAYAHGEGVLHRDIKPSNLLLDRTGNVWITDFGLAKTEGDALTCTGDVLGTPRYLAPESLQGIADERTDVYGVGVTLYELLTVTPAFAGKSRHEILRLVSEVDPARPRRINPAIPGDLETIVLTAMAKEPSQRYESASALAEDLDRFLRGQPIVARRATLTYRVGLFFKRHPVAVSASIAMLTLLMAVGIGWALSLRSALEREQQQHRATAVENQVSEANFRLAVAAVRQMLTRVSHELVDEPHTRRVRLELKRDAIRFYEEFLKHRTGDLALRYESARAWKDLGSFQQEIESLDVQAVSLDNAEQITQALIAENPKVAYSHLLLEIQLQQGFVLHHQGHLEAAEKRIREALALAERLHDSLASEAAADSVLMALKQLGHMLYAARKGTGLEVVNRGIRLADEIIEERPEDVSVLRDLVACLRYRAGLYNGQGNYSEARIDLERAIDISNLLARLNPNHSWDQYYLAMVYGHLAVSTVQSGNVSESVRISRLRVGLLDKLCADFPSSVAYGQERAKARRQLGVLLEREGRIEEAAKFVRLAADEFDSLKDRGSVTGAESAARARRSLGRLLMKLEKPDEAKESFLKAIATNEQLLEETPGAVFLVESLAGVYGSYGIFLSNQKDQAGALTYYEKAADLIRGLVDSPAVTSELRSNFARQLVNLANAYRRNQQLADAESTLNEAVLRANSMIEDYPENPSGLRWLAYATHRRAALAKDQRDGAARLAHQREACQLYRRVVAMDPNDSGCAIEYAQVVGELTRMLHKEKLFEEAREALVATLESSTKALSLGRGKGHLVWLLDLHSETCVALKRLEEAATLIRQAAETQPERLFLWGLVAERLASCASADESVAEPAHSVFASQAHVALREALDRGFADRKQLERSKDLAPLLQTEPFRELLERLEGNEPPPEADNR